MKKQKHQFPSPHFDEGCIKCGGFEGEPCEPPVKTVFPSDKTLRNQISEILVKWDMPTRQVAISEIIRLFETYYERKK